MKAADSSGTLDEFGTQRLLSLCRVYLAAQEITGDICVFAWLDGNEVDDEFTDADVLQLVADELLAQIELFSELFSGLFNELFSELFNELVELRPIALSTENMVEFKVSLSGWTSSTSFSDSFRGSVRESFSVSLPSSLLLSWLFMELFGFVRLNGSPVAGSFVLLFTDDRRSRSYRVISESMSEKISSFVGWPTSDCSIVLNR